jgi:hypothetical protein
VIWLTWLPACSPGQCHIGYYGPAAQAAAADFFSDGDPRFETNDQELPTRLTLGHCPLPADFPEKTEYLALMDEQERLAAVVTSTQMLGRLLAAAPTLLTAARLAHYWLTERAGETAGAGDIGLIHAAIAQATGDFGWSEQSQTET